MIEKTSLRLIIALFCQASLLFIGSCSSDADEPVATVDIIMPVDQDTVITPEVNVAIAIANFDLNADQHSAFYRLNESEEVTIGGIDFVVSELEDGMNTVSVGLKHRDEVLSADEIRLFYYSGRDSVAIINGTGTGRYQQGVTVVIEAYAKEIPYIFDYWKGDTGFLADSTLSPAFFTKPEHAVRLEAIYKVDSVYFHDLQVTYGTGSGKYLPGETVQVSLAMDAPLVFTHWSGGDDFLTGDSLSADVTFEMPERDVHLVGEWEVLNVSFGKHLYPIFERRCNDTGCHGVNGAPSYQAWEAIAADAQNIVNKTQSGNMPPPLYGQLTDEELEIIRVWVEEGYQDN